MNGRRVTRIISYGPLLVSTAVLSYAVWASGDWYVLVLLLAGASWGLLARRLLDHAIERIVFWRLGTNGLMQRYIVHRRAAELLEVALAHEMMHADTEAMRKKPQQPWTPDQPAL